MKLTDAVVLLFLSSWRVAAQAEDNYWTEVDLRNSLYFFQRSALFINRSLQVDSGSGKFHPLLWTGTEPESEEEKASEDKESKDNALELGKSEENEPENKKTGDPETESKTSENPGSKSHNGKIAELKKSKNDNSTIDDSKANCKAEDIAKVVENVRKATKQTKERLKSHEKTGEETVKDVRDVTLEDEEKGEAHVETEVKGNGAKTKATVEEAGARYDMDIDDQDLGSERSKSVAHGTREDAKSKTKFHVDKSVTPNETVTVVKSEEEKELDNGKKTTRKVKHTQKESSSKREEASEEPNETARENGTEGGQGEKPIVNEHPPNVTEENQPFAKKTKTRTTKANKETVTNETHIKKKENETEITEEIIEVAEISEIASVYLCLFTPLGVAWAVYVHLGSQRKHAMILLPVMMGAMNVGFDLVNQSLALIMGVPAAITTVQALGMAMIMMIWSLVSERERIRDVSSQQWLTWLFVALLYSLYQLSNHLAYEKCSLSERTVFLNLGPIVAIMLEFVVLPERMQKMLTFRIKLSLFIMLVGAVLFSLQISDFTTSGMSAASLLVMTNVGARLAQRAYLGNPDQSNVPIPPLVCLDGLVVAFAAGTAATTEMRTLFDHWGEWTQDSSVLLMLILSAITFTGGHVAALYLLQMNSSAVTLLVYQNVVNILDVFFGNLWFHDQAFENTASAIGLSISLICGVWYSVEVLLADIRKGAAINGKTDEQSEKEGPGLTDSDRTGG